MSHELCLAVYNFITLLSGRNSPPHAATAPTIIGANRPNELHSDTLVPLLLLLLLLLVLLMHTLAAADTNVHSALALNICNICKVMQHRHMHKDKLTKAVQ
jgi:hypothetical protein